MECWLHSLVVTRAGPCWNKWRDLRPSVVDEKTWKHDRDQGWRLDYIHAMCLPRVYKDIHDLFLDRVTVKL